MNGIVNTGAAVGVGINSTGNIVGGLAGAAFFLPNGGSPQTMPGVGAPSTALGINDTGNMVGQYTVGATTPGFYVKDSAGDNLTTINAPSGPDTVNAQGINNSGLIVGFYLGTDGQDHGFMGNIADASGGMLTGTAIADPTIPPVPGEPGATFVFSAWKSRK